MFIVYYYQFVENDLILLLVVLTIIYNHALYLNIYHVLLTFLSLEMICQTLLYRFDAPQYDLIFSTYGVVNCLFGYHAILAPIGCSLAFQRETIEMQIFIFEI